jgi:hypothetical protein
LPFRFPPSDSREDFYLAFANSFFFSADVANAGIILSPKYMSRIMLLDE